VSPISRATRSFIAGMARGSPSIKELERAGGPEFLYCESRARSSSWFKLTLSRGAPSAPRTALKVAPLPVGRRQMKVVEEFSTFGALRRPPFEEDGTLFLAVSNSLTP